MARTVSRVTPPEASSSALSPVMATASRIFARSKLSRRISFTPAANASRSCSSVSTSTWSITRGFDVVLRRADRRGKATGGMNVVFLHEDAVEEADAVIGPAARRNRVFLRDAQPRQRLARIEDSRPGPLDRLHVRPGPGRHSRKQLHEVDGRALARKDRAGIALQLAQGTAGDNVVPIVVVPEDLDVGIEFLEGAVEPLGAAEHAILARHQARLGGAIRWHELRGEVAAAHVLGKRMRHVAGDRLFEGVEGVWHRRGFREPILLEFGHG